MTGDSGGNSGVVPVVFGVEAPLSDAGRRIVEKLGATQERVRAATSALTGKGTGTDSDYALTDERFEGIPAQQLYDSVHGQGGMDVTGLETMRAVWNSATTELGAVSIGMQTRVLALLNEGALTGQAGEAAAAAAIRLGQVANQVSEVFAAVTGRAEQLYYTAEAVRAAVQQPPLPMATIDPNDPVRSLIPGIANPETVTLDREAENQVRAANVAAMNAIYKPGYPPAGSGVPAYTVVPGALAGDGPGASGTPGGIGTPGGTGAPGTPGAADNDSLDAPNTETGATDDTAEPPDSSTPAGHERDRSGETNSPVDQGQTTPAATTAPATVSAASTGPGSAGLGSTGGGGLGSASPGVGGSLGAAPGSPVPGQAAASGPTSSAGGSSGRPGGSPMMGPMGGGAGQRRGEPDPEHTAPDYLRRVHPDWFDGITAHGPVLGAETIAAESNTEYDDPFEYAPTATPTTVAPQPVPPPPSPVPAATDSAPHQVPAEPTPTADAAPTPESSAVPAEIAALLSHYEWGPATDEHSAPQPTTEPEPGPR